MATIPLVDPSFPGVWDKFGHSYFYQNPWYQTNFGPFAFGIGNINTAGFGNCSAIGNVITRDYCVNGQAVPTGNNTCQCIQLERKVGGCGNNSNTVCDINGTPIVPV